MFDWIQRMYDSVTGRIDNVIRGWVHDLVNGLYGFLHVIFSSVAREWVRLVRVTQGYTGSLISFAHAVWAKLYAIARIIIPRIIAEYRRLIHDVSVYAQNIYHDALRRIAEAIRYAEHLVHSAITWVIRNVYDPLARLLTQAWHWITHEGDTIWQYITHPDRLAALIFGSLIALLEREAWSVADRLGKFFLSLVVRNLRQFALLIEDVLNAIL